MSNVKRLVPEDFTVLDGTELDGSPTAATDEVGIGWALFELNNSIDRMEQSNIIVGVNPNELRGYATRLQNLAAKIEKPF